MKTQFAKLFQNVKSVMDEVFVDDIAVMYNFEGLQGKKSFKKLECFKLIRGKLLNSH